MGRRKKNVSKHHILPSSRGGTSELENLVMLKIKEHQYYHNLFENQTPDEIVETLVNKYWGGNWNYVKEAYQRNCGIYSQ